MYTYSPCRLNVYIWRRFAILDGRIIACHDGSHVLEDSIMSKTLLGHTGLTTGGCNGHGKTSRRQCLYQFVCTHTRFDFFAHGT
mmetsp:Transcript_84558/g.244432  ORF Transcript_84558/g.244432 Transcript_84558/m.244432 type:complete len:84 (-) Transcript_84558:281-532(-)